jgi:hypothetical protein
MTYEIQQALLAVTGESRDLRKKRNTILRVAMATATDEPLAKVWQRSDTCNKHTWYGGGSKAGWIDEPEVKHALHLATKRAEWWVDVKLGRAVEKTLELLVDVAPAGAAQFARVIREGRMQFERNGQVVYEEASVAEATRIISDVLNRVSTKTAPKATLGLDADTFAQLRRQAQEEAAQDVQAALTEWERHQAAMQGDGQHAAG